MAVSFVELEETTQESVTTMVFDAPTDLEEGDFIIAQGSMAPGSAPLASVPTGFIRIAVVTTSVDTGSKRKWIYAKYATASEPSTYTFTTTGAAIGVGVLANFRADGGSIIPDIGIPDQRRNQTTTWTVRGFDAHLGGLPVALLLGTSNTGTTGSSGPTATGWTKRSYNIRNGTSSATMLTRDTDATAGETIADLACTSDVNADYGLFLMIVLTDADATAVPFILPKSFDDTATATFSTSHVSKVPTHVENDLLWTLLTVQSGSVTVTPPGGWTIVSEDVTQGDASGLRAIMAVKVASGSEPATYTWTLSGTAFADSTCGAVPNGNKLVATEGTPEIINVASAGTAKTIPEVDQEIEGCVTIWWTANRSAAGATSTPNSYNKIMGLGRNSVSQMQVTLGFQHSPNSKPTGTIGLTAQAATSSISNRLALTFDQDYWTLLIESLTDNGSFGSIYPLLLH